MELVQEFSQLETAEIFVSQVIPLNLNNLKPFKLL